jgi:hypothetical protein
MTDNQFIQLFLPIIQAGLVTDGFLDVIVKAANQPTQQGVNSGPTVYFYKIATKRYGFLGRRDVWDTGSGTMTHTESQYYETTFQVSALVRQFPITPNQYTAGDLINEVASIMQSDDTRAILNASGVGILRIQDIPNPYFVDDRDQFEASPSIEFVLTSQAFRVKTDPRIELPVLLNIQGV